MAKPPSLKSNKSESKPKNTSQGMSQNTRHSRTSRNGPTKKYRGQGK